MTDADRDALGAALQQATVILIDCLILGARDLGLPGGALPPRSGKSEADLYALAGRLAPVVAAMTRRRRE